MSSTYLLITLDTHNGDKAPQSYKLNLVTPTVSERFQNFWKFQKCALLKHNPYNPEATPTDFCTAYCCWNLWEHRSLNTMNRDTINLCAA